MDMAATLWSYQILHKQLRYLGICFNMDSINYLKLDEELRIQALYQAGSKPDDKQKSSQTTMLRYIKDLIVMNLMSLHTCTGIFALLGAVWITEFLFFFIKTVTVIAIVSATNYLKTNVNQKQVIQYPVYYH